MCTASETPRPSKRLERAAIVRDLVLAGWRPPPLKHHQAERLLDDIARIGGDERHHFGLTPHEQRVLAMVADGMTHKDIALELGNAPDTIRKLEGMIRRKLGARNNAHAVAISLRS